MDEKIEITEKAVRKSAGQEKTFVDMLNQEVKELQSSMQVDELSNQICMGAIDYTTQRDIKPHRNGVHGHIAERLTQKGYRKESDTAREILTLIKNGVELNSMIDGDAKIAIMNELRWAGQKYGVDLGE